ncbi:uncharacterized protein MYCFIDRAFT_2620, partial [Pseudocercospora fijiensis CIRAD86]
RTRDGCMTCRRRRIRCDQARPTCANCSRKGFQCMRQVQLKWQADYKSQNLAFGREGVWRKHRTSADRASSRGNKTWVQYPLIQAYNFISHTVDRDTGSMIGSTSFLKEQHHLNLDLERPFSTFPNAAVTVDASVLSYYVQNLCPLTTLSRHARSPFVTLIIPSLPTASSAVLDAILALAACHGSSINKTWAASAAQLEARAIHSLRHRLANMTEYELATDPDIHIVTMMLCLYEIVNKCDKQWVIHLKGAREIARTRRRLISANQVEQGLLRFTDSFFAFQDVIGRTACGEEPIFDNTYWDASDARVDAWLGCSPALVAVICQATELSRQKRDLTAFEFQARAAGLEAQLERLEQIVPDANDTNLQKSADVKYLAASVVIHCALNDALPNMNLVRRLVAQILLLVKWFVEQSLGAGLLWPLFVAAAELDPTNDDYATENGSDIIVGRAFVLRALDCLAISSVTNVSKARQVITEIWQARDEAVEDVPTFPTNDWEHYVAPRSSNLSL